MRATEQNRLVSTPPKVVRADTEEQQSFLEERLVETERQVKEAVWSSPLLREEEKLLCSIPGVEKQTAHVLMAELLESGEANRQETEKLAAPPTETAVHIAKSNAPEAATSVR